ncbi:hypothetical protein [Fibrivirga algicola]|uniref:Apea-like HEPN domain-containing protein n=1 Tax=Fibrivirga algicola TaxID=2950420 RepID=A0ABX0QAU7_9BACT|nr:hypothetical protein [Fibrivirga algicola]NID09395.1 hypothetical protein [Fibrivirga algicola]
MLESPDRNKLHKYLQNSNKPLEGRIPFASLLLAEQYLSKKNKTIKQWKEDKVPAVVNWENKIEKRTVTSKGINYVIILNHIKKYGYFNPKQFDLYSIREDFLDLKTEVGVALHTKDKRTSIELWNSSNYLGENFPITPNLGREGIIISCFLDQLLHRVAKNRELIVLNSNDVFSIDWLFSFKDLINDVISTLEIFLHLIYNKAQFDPLNGWVFDKDILGSSHGRRLTDKLKWIYQISGKHLGIESYKNSLLFVKELRNHLNHFDPPVFCIAIEEIADVLNYIVDIGMIHIEIRKVLNLKISSTLINFILQPQIVFVPEKMFSHRKPLDYNSEGYNSCRWPKGVD